MIGFTKSIAKEGQRYNIKANVIAPMAASRLTEKLLPGDLKTFTAPEYVAPVVTLLAHETCPDSGELIEVAAGWVTKIRWQRAEGVFLKPPFTAEQIKGKWNQTSDYSQCDYPQEIHETILVCLQNSKESSSKL